MVFSLLDEKILEEIEKNRSALDQAMDEFEVSRKNSSVSNLFHKFIKIWYNNMGDFYAKNKRTKSNITSLSDLFESA